MTMPTALRMNHRASPCSSFMFIQQAAAYSDSSPIRLMLTGKPARHLVMPMPAMRVVQQLLLSAPIPLLLHSLPSQTLASILVRRNGSLAQMFVSETTGGTVPSVLLYVSLGLQWQHAPILAVESIETAIESRTSPQE